MSRKLSDADVEAIAIAISRQPAHACRFAEIEARDLNASILFYKHFVKIIEESGSTFRKTLLVLIITGAVSLSGWGVVAKLKQIVPGP